MPKEESDDYWVQLLGSKVFDFHAFAIINSYNICFFCSSLYDCVVDLGNTNQSQTQLITLHARQE